MHIKKITAYVFILYITTVSFFLQAAYSQAGNEQPFKKIRSIQETFEAIPFSSIKPSGWLKEEIEKKP